MCRIHSSFSSFHQVFRSLSLPSSVRASSPPPSRDLDGITAPPPPPPPCPSPSEPIHSPSGLHQREGEEDATGERERYDDEDPNYLSSLLFLRRKRALTEVEGFDNGGFPLVPTSTWIRSIGRIPSHDPSSARRQRKRGDGRRGGTSRSWREERGCMASVV